MLIKTTLAVPSNRLIRPKTFQCLMELVARGGYDWHIIVPEEGYSIAENRNYAAVQALKNKSDYLLFIDDDMTFPPDILDTLLANQKDICGVAYHSRGSADIVKRVPGDIEAIVETDKEKYINLANNTDPKYMDTFECYATGTGIMLIKCEIFYKIPRPWFQFEYYDNGCCKTGEDWYWCIKAKKYGFKTFTDAKPQINHLGEKII